MATATTDPVRLPPALRLPKLVTSVIFLTSLQYSVAPWLSRHYCGPMARRRRFAGCRSAAA
jgi:hypothetical protein